MLCLHTQCCYRARVVDGCRRLVAFRTRPRAEHKEGAGTLHDCGPCPSLLRPAKLSHLRFGIRQIGIMGGRGRGRRAVRFANQPQVGRAGRVCCLSAKSVRYNFFLSVFIVLPRNDRNLLLYTLRKLKVGLGDTYRS